MILREFRNAKIHQPSVVFAAFSAPAANGRGNKTGFSYLCDDFFGKAGLFGHLQKLNDTVCSAFIESDTMELFNHIALVIEMPERIAVNIASKHGKSGF